MNDTTQLTYPINSASVGALKSVEINSEAELTGEEVAHLHTIAIGLAQVAGAMCGVRHWAGMHVVCVRPESALKAPQAATTQVAQNAPLNIIDHRLSTMSIGCLVHLIDLCAMRWRA